MRLVKRICKLCATEHSYTWSDLDDRKWRRGVVLCPINSDDDEVQTASIFCTTPPTCCKYAAEQCVEQNEI